MGNKKVFVIAIFILGCNGLSNKKKNISSIQDYLVVKLLIRVEEDDAFEIFYSENLEDSYKPTNRVRVDVKGKATFQEVVFKFPDRTYPLKLRIDLGSSGFETDIELREIVLSTGGKDRKITFNDIGLYFRPNMYLNFNGNNETVQRRKVAGKYDPFLLSNDLTEIITDIFTE